MIVPYSLESLGLVDAPEEETFDNLTILAARMLDTPVALVSFVEFEKDRQYFKSHYGLPEPWATTRQTPLSHSFCRHVVQNDAPLVVVNAPQHELVCDNGAVKDLNVIAYLGVPVYDSTGKPVAALCVIDGVPRAWSESAVRELEQLARCVSDAIYLKAAVKTSEALRAEQEAFTYAISHDLKAPTNTLQLLVHELAEVLGDGIDAEAFEFLGLCRETIARMGQQVEGVLGYTRALATTVDHAPVNLEAVVAEVLADLKAEIEASGSRVSIEALPTVVGAMVQLRVLFENLIANALKFRRRTVEPEIHISAVQTGNVARITIQDNGIGIAAEHHERIFKMFQRMHVRDEYPGAGLGLSLCQRVVMNHGGRIDVDSTPGSGSKFTVQLPGVVR